MEEKLIELVKDALEECRSITDCRRCKGYNKGRWCQCVLIADHLIANGVVIQKRAYWKPLKMYAGEYFCSECGEMFPDLKTEYCCECGAKMVDAPKDGDT